MNIKLDKYEQALFYEIFNKREYGVLDDIIKQSEIILDIGGHIGLFSLYSLSLKSGVNPILDNGDLVIDFTQSSNSDFKIFYFEPVKNYFDKARIILKNFNKSIIFNNFGFSNVSGIEKMYSSKISSQTSIYNSFLTKGGIIIKNCKFHQLNKYIFDCKLTKIDLAKIDVEGEEFNILLGLDEKYFQLIENIFIEYHILDLTFENKYLQLIKILKKNYKSVVISESKYNSNIGYILCTN